MARSKHPPDHPIGADALNAAADLADKFCEYAHPADALAIAAPLLSHVGQTPADLDAAVSLMVRQARALRQLSRFGEALGTLEQALTLMERYEVDPAQRALLLDVQADTLSASGQLQRADRVFATVAALKRQLNHTGTPQNYRHIARRVEHELRQGHRREAADLMKQFDVKTPAAGKASRRHVEWLLLQGEIAEHSGDRRAAVTFAKEALARLDLLPEPVFVRDHRARALSLLARTSGAAGRPVPGASLLSQAASLRADMARIGFPD
jgi:tetratricopeptide (TPR) repeat protein